MSALDTKNHIRKTAAELFADHGYDSVSIKTICEKSKCNIAAVHYHFGSKEKLYRSIFQDFGKNKLNKLKLLLDKPKSTEDFKLRLELYLNQAISLIEEEPHVAKIIMRDGHLINEMCKDIFQSTFFKLYQALQAFFKEAQRMGIISKKADIFALMQIIDSILCARAFEQKELKKTVMGKEFIKQRNQKRWVDSILTILFDGFMKKEKK